MAPREHAGASDACSTALRATLPRGCGSSVMRRNGSPRRPAGATWDARFRARPGTGHRRDATRPAAGRSSRWSRHNEAQRTLGLFPPQLAKLLARTASSAADLLAPCLRSQTQRPVRTINSGTAPVRLIATMSEVPTRFHRAGKQPVHQRFAGVARCDRCVRRGFRRSSDAPTGWAPRRCSSPLRTQVNEITAVGAAVRGSR